MRALQAGDNVQVLRPDGTTTLSPVLMFLHEDPAAVRSFLTLVTRKGHRLTLTPSHLVVALRREDATSASTAADMTARGRILLAGVINVGDLLLIITNETKPFMDPVVDIQTSWEQGVFAPLTSEGTVVVDNVAASTYAVIDSQSLAHWAFLPVRVYYKLKNIVLATLSGIGMVSESEPFSNHINVPEYANKTLVHTDIQIHWYPKALYKLAKWILPGHLVYS